MAANTTTPPAGARDAVTDAAVSLRGLAGVIRKHGTCAPSALEVVAERLEALTGKADGLLHDYPNTCPTFQQWEAAMAPTPAASGLKFPESYDRRFWQVGVCGNANIVTYDGEDVHGVAWVSDPHTIVKAHNDCIRHALAAQPAPVVGGSVDTMVEILRTSLDADIDAGESLHTLVIRASNALYWRGKEIEELRELLSTRPAESVAQGGEGMADAYHGAMEDKDDWKRQAQTAHAILRTLGYTGIVPTEPPKPVGYTNWASVKATDSGFVCMREWQAGFFTIPLFARIDT